MTTVDRRPARSLMRRRREEPGAPDGAPPTVDQGAVARAVRDELERQERVRRARATVAVVKEERAREEAENARLSGGPCVYCGVTWSARRDGSGTVSPAWYTGVGGPCCTYCDTDRRRLGVHWGQDRPDSEHRDHVVRDLIGDESVTRYWTGPYLAQKTGFRWWHETPGAEPGGRVRFRYVDRQALRAALHPERPAAQDWYTSRGPCPRCGCAHMWRQAADRRDGRSNAIVPGRWVCHGCVEYGDSLSEVISKLVGIDASSTLTTNQPARRPDGTPLSWMSGVLGALGATWFNDRDTSRDGRRDLTLTPFAYLDVPAIRRRAYELFPQANMWRSPVIWAQLRDEAEHAAS